MSKALFLCFICFLFAPKAFAAPLPPHPEGQTYIAEQSGNWVYLPKTDKIGEKNIICLALANAPPYAVTLRGISGEFGLTITHKGWNLPAHTTQNITLSAMSFQVRKIFYPLDSDTVGTTLSPSEQKIILQNFAHQKNIHFELAGSKKFTLPLKGSARILSLLSSCLKESHLP